MLKIYGKVNDDNLTGPMVTSESSSGSGKTATETSALFTERLLTAHTALAESYLQVSERSRNG